MLDSLLWFLAGGLTSTVIHLGLSVRRIITPDGKVRITVAVLPFNAVQRVLFVSVGLVSVIGTIAMARVATDENALAARQTACNAQLIAAINARADVTDQDSTNLNNLLTGIGQIIGNSPSAAARAQAQKLFLTYLRARDANNKQRQAHPLPPVNCGK